MLLCPKGQCYDCRSIIDDIVKSHLFVILSLFVRIKRTQGDHIEQMHLSQTRKQKLNQFKVTLFKELTPKTQNKAFEISKIAFQSCGAVRRGRNGECLFRMCSVYQVASPAHSILF